MKDRRVELPSQRGRETGISPARLRRHGRMLTLTIALSGLAAGGGPDQATAAQPSALREGVLLLPLQVSPGDPPEAVFTALTLHHVLEHVTFADGRLEEAWAHWHLSQLFPNELALSAWLDGRTRDLPRGVDALGLRFVAGGTLDPGLSPSVALWVQDLKTRERSERRAAADLPGLVAFRQGFIDLLRQSGVPLTESQRTPMLWHEELPPKAADLLGRGLLSLGRSILGHDDQDAAQHSLESALENAPRSYIVANLLGSFRLHEQGRPEAARGLLEQALALNPAGADAAEDLALSFAHVGDLESARRWGQRSGEMRGLDSQAALLAFLPRLGDALLGSAEGHSRAGEYEEAAAALTDALDAFRELQDRPSQGKVLTELGFLNARLGRHESVIETHGEALVLRHDLGIQEGEGALLYSLGITYARLGRHEEAVRHLEQSMASPDTAAQPANQAMALESLGDAYRPLGELGKAVTAFEQARAISRRLGDPEAELQVLLKLGSTMAALGELAEAIRHSRDAVRLSRELQDRRGEATALFVLATAQARSGDSDAAIDNYERALAVDRELGDRESERVTLEALVSLLEEAAELRKAAARYEELVALLQALGDRRGEGASLNSLGLVYAELGEDEKATGCYTRALAVARETSDAGIKGPALGNLGLLSASRGEDAEAIEYYERALSLARAAEDRLGEVTTLENLAAAHRRLGHHREAIGREQEAVFAFRGLGDRSGEAAALESLALAYNSVSEFQSSTESYEKALAIYREIEDPSGEASALWGLGLAYDNLDDRENAIDHFEQALSIQHQVGDRAGQALTLSSLATAYSKLGDYEKGLGHQEQALALHREIADKSGEARDVQAIGFLQGLMGSYREEIGYYEQALEVWRQLGDGAGEAETLQRLGHAYQRLGQPERVLPYYEKALAAAREAGDRWSEARSSRSVGEIYVRLGRQDEALSYFERAITIQRDSGDRQEEALTLAIMGWACVDLREYKNAVRFFELALDVFRSTGQPLFLGRRHRDLAVAYAYLGQPEKAVASLREAIAVARRVRDIAGEAGARDLLGWIYARLGQYENATRELGEALGLLRSLTGHPEGWVLEGLAAVWEKRGAPEVAIFYGKQAVNALQESRGNIRDLDQDTQRAFLEMHRDPYRGLANLLISEGRLPEAQQVLALLKEQEYFEFVRRDAAVASSLEGRADLTQREAAWEKRHRQAGDRLAALGAERGALLAKDELSPEQDERLAHLEGELEMAGRAFQQFLDSLAEEARQGRGSKERVFQIREAQGLMEDLRELGSGAVALYTLVTEEKLRIILVTPDVQKAAESSIGSAELGRKVLAFREALQSPSSDPLPLARELYEAVIAPVAGDLEAAKAKTLMWSLDGVLRYLPLSALHDGERYLVESYRNVVFTPASQARLKDEPKAQWRVLGLGVSRGHEGFEPLPGVVQELDGIVQEGNEDPGVLPGTVRLDEAFTLEEMRAGLRKRYPLVHIASHFQFRPGNETDSFLLLGDGTHLTLAHLKSLPNVFGGVDLLSLSACNTAMGGAGADGKEVEGFGVLAQRQGAKAVLATLWAVSDESTQALMNDFYRRRETGLSKAEALRQAQVALLRGSVAASTEVLAARGAILEEDSVKSGEKRVGPGPDDAYAHPYYWAPFILIGNWK